MEERMSAVAYAKARGYPVATIRRLCRTNVLACVQFGKVYSLHVSAADAYFAGKEAERRAKAERLQQAKTRPVRDQDFQKLLKSLRAEILGEARS